VLGLGLLHWAGVLAPRGERVGSDDLARRRIDATTRGRPIATSTVRPPLAADEEARRFALVAGAALLVLLGRLAVRSRP
jgi:hypothetical protein